MRKLAQLRDELAGPDPDILLQLSVERVLATWLQVSYYEILASDATAAYPRKSDLVDKRLTQAQRRYLLALSSLAGIKRVIAGPGHRSSSAEKRPAQRASGPDCHRLAAAS